MNTVTRTIWSFASGAIIGTLGGLMGLGGAEFRLPVLVGLFKFKTLQAIVLNLVMSLVTIVFSLAFRSLSIPIIEVLAYYDVIFNLLSGSLIGAFIGVKLATNIDAHKLDRVVFIFLLMLGAFIITHSLIHFEQIQTGFVVRLLLGFLAGLFIGILSSMLGVAGGELIIPTVIILFAIDIKLAGSISLFISLPTVLTGIFRYRNSNEFAVVKTNRGFLAAMAVGSILGAFVGSRMLPWVSSEKLQIILGFILLISAIKTFLHASSPVKEKS